MSSIFLPVSCIITLFFAIPSDGLLRMIIDFDRYEAVNGSDYYNMEKIRVRKYNRTLSVLNGTAEVFVDLDNRYKFGVSFARSTLGNNQFQEYPMKLAPKPFCDFIYEYYREYQHLFLKFTNLPYMPVEGICPFPKGSYWVKDAFVDASIVPPVVPDGQWRSTMDTIDTVTGELVARNRMYIRFTKELM